MNYDDINRVSLNLRVKRNFFFVCEGQKTEVNYFNSLHENSRKINLRDNVKINIYKKEGDEAGFSSAQGVLQLALKYKEELIEAGKYVEGTDRVVIVFDLDVLRKRQTINIYEDILKRCEEEKIYVAVTNPAFELFLMLHHEDSIEKVIQPNYSIILENKKPRGDKRRPVERMLSSNYQVNSKQRAHYNDIVGKVKVAIENEKHDIINNDIKQGLELLTCNVGCLISEMF